MAFSDGIHYFVTLLFFIVFLLIVLALTQQLVNFNVSPSDTFAVDAKDTLISAVTIGLFFNFIIIIGLVIAGVMIFMGNDQLSKGSSLGYATGQSSLTIATRVIVFSLLVIGSVIVGALTLSSYKLINDSDNPSQYSTISAACLHFGQLLYLHIIILFTIQGIVFLFQNYNKSNKSNNEQLEMTMDKINSQNTQNNILDTFDVNVLNQMIKSK